MMNVCVKLHHRKSLSLSEMMLNLVDVINPTARRKAKIVSNFGFSECNRVQLCSMKHGSRSKSANDTGVQCHDINFVMCHYQRSFSISEMKINEVNTTTAKLQPEGEPNVTPAC